MFPSCRTKIFNTAILLSEDYRVTFSRDVNPALIADYDKGNSQWTSCSVVLNRHYGTSWTPSPLIRAALIPCNPESLHTMILFCLM